MEPMGVKKDKDRISTSAKIGGIFGLVVFAALLLMPTPEGMSIAGQRSMAVFFFALILWVARPIPIYQTSILAILLLPMIGAVAKEKIAFGTLGYPVIWLMVAAFVLTSAISQTNVGSRLALTLVTKMGKTPRGSLTAFMIANFIIAFFVPSTTARAALFIPIVVVILEVYKQYPGESMFGKLMTLQGVQNNAFATSMIMTATSSQVIAMGFINDMAGGDLGYMNWLMGSMPQAVFTAIVMFFLGYHLFDAEKGLKSNDESIKILKKQLADLGPVSTREKRAAAIFLFTLFLWATEDYQAGWIGFEISTVQTAVLSMFLCLSPAIGVITWKQADIKWDLMIFSAGAYAVGGAFNKSGGAGYLVKYFVDAVGLESMSHSMVAIILISTTVFSHLIFTSKTVRTTILIPIIITLGKSLGMDAVQLALACSFGIAYTITLPPHSKVNTLYFSTGYFTVADELKFGLLACTIGSIAISFIYFFWLPIIL